MENQKSLHIVRPDPGYSVDVSEWQKLVRPFVPHSRLDVAPNLTLHIGQARYRPPF